MTHHVSRDLRGGHDEAQRPAFLLGQRLVIIAGAKFVCVPAAIEFLHQLFVFAVPTLDLEVGADFLRSSRDTARDVLAAPKPGDFPSTSSSSLFQVPVLFDAGYYEDWLCVGHRPIAPDQLKNRGVRPSGSPAKYKENAMTYDPTAGGHHFDFSSGVCVRDSTQACLTSVNYRGRS